MKDKYISLAHGDGGELAHQLIQDVFVKAFGHAKEAQFDAALLSTKSGKLAVSTDSFVVKPAFFPGGNIGKLAIAGTVNDLAVSGAVATYITAGFIIEEGFSIEQLTTIARTMAEEATKANVQIVAGDTKVVERGSVDGIYINTTGIGFVEAENLPQPEAIEEGDAVISSGTLGDHGIAILAARGELGIQTEMKSDCATLNGLITDIQSTSSNIRIMRDPTRGGLATTLVEICEDFGLTVELEEELIPVKREVEGASDLLGFDPLYLANEGKMVCIVKQSEAEEVLNTMRNHSFGKDAALIGKVTAVKQEKGKLYLRTPLGSTRRMNRLAGMQLPRIC